MATRTKERKKALPKVDKIDMQHHPALEKMVERLSAPRLRAPGTLTTYSVTGANFLSGLKGNQPPTDSDFRRYFIRRRQNGISERTLKKEFSVLKKLALANGWLWPFAADDTPYPEDEAQSHPFRPDQVEQLIKANGKLSNTERFYLAVATTWIVRREELSRIKKRDYDGETFTIHTAKHGRKVKALIPDVLKPIFADYRPKEHNPSSLSLMFRRICAKAGLDHEKGYGWHSIRYALTTVLRPALIANRIDPAILANYVGWARQSQSKEFGDIPMMAAYTRPEILNNDPYSIFKVIYSVHPFLPLWQNKDQKAPGNAKNLPKV